MRKSPGKLYERNPMSAVTAEDVAATISAALRLRFDRTRHAAKAIARRVETTPRAVEDWLQGETAPRSAELIRLCAEFDEVFDAVCTLAGRKPGGAGLTPAQREALSNLIKTLEGQ
jgi:transcriptional regulator with XRE-family HTH domain